jgi:cell division septation protein DedD
MKRFALAIASVGFIGAAFAPSVLADEWNKKTILTVNEPIQVPNKVLPPGKYVMRLLDSPSNRHIVQIFNGDETQLQTTVLAIPNYRLEPTGKTQFQFWETPPNQPKALRAWFYPGDNFGQEFAYPKSEATSIATYTKEQVPTTYAQSEADLTTARVGTVDEKGTEAELPAKTYNMPSETAQATPPATPAPAPTEEAARTAEPAATPAATPQALPHTASPYPLLGMAGLLSLGAFFTLRKVRAS